MTEKEKENVRQKLKQEIDERSTQMVEKDNQIKNIENQLGTIKNNV